MNPIAEEIRSYYGCSSEEDSLEHYGMPRRSGRLRKTLAAEAEAA